MSEAPALHAPILRATQVTSASAALPLWTRSILPSANASASD